MGIVSVMLCVENTQSKHSLSTATQSSSIHSTSRSPTRSVFCIGPEPASPNEKSRGSTSTLLFRSIVRRALDCAVAALTTLDWTPAGAPAALEDDGTLDDGEVQAGLRRALLEAAAAELELESGGLVCNRLLAGCASAETPETLASAGRLPDTVAAVTAARLTTLATDIGRGAELDRTGAALAELKLAARLVEADVACALPAGRPI